MSAVLRIWPKGGIPNGCGLPAVLGENLPLRTVCTKLLGAGRHAQGLAMGLELLGKRAVNPS
jgi:hypothetical protein